jgi:hypothetical protein
MRRWLKPHTVAITTAMTATANSVVTIGARGYEAADLITSNGLEVVTNGGDVVVTASCTVSSSGRLIGGDVDRGIVGVCVRGTGNVGELGELGELLPGFAGNLVGLVLQTVKITCMIIFRLMPSTSHSGAVAATFLRNTRHWSSPHGIAFDSECMSTPVRDDAATSFGQSLRIA